MGVIFSLAYVYTKRIAVPIGIHAYEWFGCINSSCGGDSIKNCRTSNIYIPSYILK